MQPRRPFVSLERREHPTSGGLREIDNKLVGGICLNAVGVVTLLLGAVLYGAGSALFIAGMAVMAVSFLLMLMGARS